MTCLSPEEVLAGIDGWRGATYEDLPGGLTNTTWKVAKDNRLAVLKIDRSKRGTALNSRIAEAQIQSRAAAAGLAAEVLAYGEHFYLTEYLDGKVWDRTALHHEGSLAAIGAALGKVHALPLVGRTFDAPAASRVYAQQASGLDKEVVELCLKLIAAAGKPRKLCCCHNDLVAENIVSTPDILFLDWEYACDNDPLFDLATLVEHHELDDVRAVELLHAYFGADGERWLRDLDARRGVYLALLCLWTAARNESRPIDGDDDLELLTERLVTRYS